MDHQLSRPARVIGPLGEEFGIEDLPSPTTKRWIARRKAAVVVAVEGGLLTLDEACERYQSTILNACLS